jgi:drug/metabolite transporter (DMT)-like permease
MEHHPIEEEEKKVISTNTTECSEKQSLLRLPSEKKRSQHVVHFDYNTMIPSTTSTSTSISQNVGTDDIPKDVLSSLQNMENNKLPTSKILPVSTLSPKISSQSQHQRVYSEFSFFTTSQTKQNLKKSNRGHHRRQSSLAQLFGRIGTGLGTILEDVQDSARDVRRSWHDEMEVGKNRFVFLESSLMRDLSILPEDMERLMNFQTSSLSTDDMRRNHGLDGKILQTSLSTTTTTATSVDTTTTTTTSIATSTTRSIDPYFALLAAVLAVSSNGTALTLQYDVPPPLKLYWRMMGTALILFPFAIRQFWKDGLPKLNVGQWTTVGLAVICYVIQNLCFITALSYTTIGNAVLFANTQALLLLVGKAIAGASIDWMEYAGAIVGFTGAILCATDENRTTITEKVSRSNAGFGDLLSMISAVFGVGYLTFAKAVRPATSVVTFMFLIMSVGSCMVLLYLMIMIPQLTANFHPYHGIFGWMKLRYDRLPLELWIIIVCNLVGTMGFVRSMQYFDSIIIAISTLLEPMVASVIATLMHVGVLPGLQGWLGNIMVIIGTFGVVYPSASKGDNDGAH